MRSNLFVKYPINYAFFSYLSGIFFLIGILVLESSVNNYNDPDNISKKVETILHRKEIRGIAEIKKYTYAYNTYDIIKGKNHLKEKLPEISKDGFTLQFYLNDSLVSWTDNSVNELKRSELGYRHSIMKLRNGWYDIITIRKDSLEIALLILIKYHFSFENEFLSNSFQKDFNVSDNIGISKSPGGRLVHSFSGFKLFYLDFKNFQPCYDSSAFILLFLLLCGFISFAAAFYFIYSSFPRLNNKPCLFIVCFSTDLLILRLIQAWFKFPSQLYSTELFSPHLYSSSFILPSAGDYLANSLLLLLVSIILYKKLYYIDLPFKATRTNRNILLLLSVFFILLAFTLITYALDDMVRNSSFSLDLKDISKVGWNSLIGLGIVFILFLSFFLLTKLAGRNAARMLRGNKGKSSLLILVIAVIYFFLSRKIWDLQTAILTMILLVAYFFYLLFGLKDSPDQRPFNGLLIPLAWVSILIALMFNNANFYRERENRKLVAVKLATGKNPVTEMMYGQIERNIINDSVIRESLEKCQL